MLVIDFPSKELLVTSVKNGEFSQELTVVLCDAFNLTANLSSTNRFKVGDLIIGSAKNGHLIAEKSKRQGSPKERLDNIFRISNNITKRTEDLINNNKPTFNSMSNLRETYIQLGLACVGVLIEVELDNKGQRIVLATLARTIVRDSKKQSDYRVGKYGEMEKVPEKALDVQKSIKNLRDDIISVEEVAKGCSFKLEGKKTKQQTLEFF